MLDPPAVRDFAGTYSEWVRMQSAPAPKKQAPASREKPRPAPPQRESGRKKDNPYLRPFGRLTMPQLEQEIQDTEVALAECQQGFNDAEAFKDPSRGKQLQAELGELSKKLKQLEAEYLRGRNRERRQETRDRSEETEGYWAVLPSVYCLLSTVLLSSFPPHSSPASSAAASAIALASSFSRPLAISET